MKAVLWVCPALLSACAVTPEVATPSGADAAFASAYALFVRADERECIYSLTDTGTTHPREITESLRKSYDLKRGIEVLHENSTPAQCIAKAKQAARSAGFLSVRARLTSGKDRLHGIP